MTEQMPSHPRRWAILWVICAALMVVVIDVTVLHVAAPAISSDLDPTALQLLWIIDVYPLIAAPLLIASGVLGDRLGRRKMLVAGLIVFGVASLAATFAPTAELLIAARALLGVGGAMIMPPTMSIIRDVFRDREERIAHQDRGVVIERLDSDEQREVAHEVHEQEERQEQAAHRECVLLQDG